MSSPGASPKPATPKIDNSTETQITPETKKPEVGKDNMADSEASRALGDSSAATTKGKAIDTGNDTAEEETVSTPKNDETWVENHNGANEPTSADGTSEAPPLPEEAIPPLPAEPLPDDGWEPRWEETAHTWYFYNRFTGKSQWENPRIPVASTTAESLQLSGPPGVSSAYATASAIEQPPELPRRPAGGYDPAIHGDYDPTAWYAQPDTQDPQTGADASTTVDPAAQYAAIGAFNRFTGRWQNTDIHNPENHNDENKSKRQMNAFFDVDAAANSHDGRSLKAERSGKKVSKSELKQFKEKRKAKKEEKRRAWLRD